MNGDMNGTIEEPMETVDTTSVEPVGNSNDCKSIVTCSETNSVDNSDNLDSKSKQGPNINNDSCSNEPESKDDCENETDKEVVDHTQSTSTMTTCSNDNNISKHDDDTSTPATENKQASDNESQGDGSESACKDTDNIVANLDELESMEDSSEAGSVVSQTNGENEAVSINSDSDPECEDDQSMDAESKDNDIIIVENENIVHEIPSDNEDVTNVETESSVKLRRSTRTKKRKHYDDSETSDEDESDIEEVMVEDPLGSHTKPIVISNAKDLVVTAVHSLKSNKNRKNELSVPINSVTSGKVVSTENKNSAASINSTVKSLYQAIFARGTTVTPIQSNNKPSSPIQQVSPENMQPPILPSLTDDMFVVEAPSFIVPYVYEKPSVKPFREFVDALGKSVDEQRIKDENENSLKHKEKKEKEKNESQAIGDAVLELEDKDKKENKKRNKERNRRRQNDDDDASWDGESSTDSEDETLSDNDDSVCLKDKTDSIASVKDIADLTIKAIAGKSESYFDCSLGKFFVNIGLNLVQEYVQNDLLVQQNRKLYREKKGGHSTKATELSIASLKKNLELSKENNAPYTLPQTKCNFCTFKSESALVISHHLETPHMKLNLYKCNYCAFEVRSPHDILYHMEAEHKVRAKLERAPCYHQCPNCPFEDNGKGKLARHQIGCAKKFKPELNLAPPIEWEPPAKIPKITKARNNVGNQYQNMLNRHMNAGNTMSKPQLPVPKLFPGGATLQASPGSRPRVRAGAPPRFAPVPGGLPILRPPSVVRHPTSSNFPISANQQRPGCSKKRTLAMRPIESFFQPVNKRAVSACSATPASDLDTSDKVVDPIAYPRAPESPVCANKTNEVVVEVVQTSSQAPESTEILSPNVSYPYDNNGKKAGQQPSISITPLPRLPQPVPTPSRLPHPGSAKSTYVICEICDGYIKDLEQLRNHMQWIHKVKIHPKMIYNRPPLNCQKCLYRFFTDQGLERHLLGTHGLVTSSMQEAANKGKDAGRCPVCGRIYQWKLLNHVSKDHNLTLKPAHLSYKCTVCAGTFGTYKQFESHVYSAHSVVAKRVMDKGKATAPASKPANTLKQLKINDEITIIPQPAKATSSKEK